jgi:hypothetical protein
VLSESLAASTLALTLAAVLQLARGVTGRRVAAVLAATALWLLARDTHASVVLVAAVALGVGLAVAEWRDRGRPEGDDARERDRGMGGLILLACWLFAFGAVAWVAASHGNRYAYPLRNVFEARVLPYPDSVSGSPITACPRPSGSLARMRCCPSLAPGGRHRWSTSATTTLTCANGSLGSWATAGGRSRPGWPPTPRSW